MNLTSDSIPFLLPKPTVPPCFLKGRCKSPTPIVAVKVIHARCSLTYKLLTANSPRQSGMFPLQSRLNELRIHGIQLLYRELLPVEINPDFNSHESRISHFLCKPRDRIHGLSFVDSIRAFRSHHKHTDHIRHSDVFETFKQFYV